MTTLATIVPTRTRGLSILQTRTNVCWRTRSGSVLRPCLKSGSPPCSADSPILPPLQRCRYRRGQDDHCSLRKKEGAALFFDFKAAFPSVLHCFSARGLAPHWPPSPVEVLHCRLVHQQPLLPCSGWDPISWIPPSQWHATRLPPLTALLRRAADLLFRRLHRLMPDARIRTHVDDLAWFSALAAQLFPCSLKPSRITPSFLDCKSRCPKRSFSRCPRLTWTRSGRNSNGFIPFGGTFTST